ncbi:hypothetical protein BDP55DRAFT_711916 [Colletotrichum godetiae]|uniref:Uncharacterized protein n=1 Tax=Colletotrichum godetiae TaxID=1209918 RepID=A0AAJ0F2C3_9PEZI|nr:uncharacterized protein BDP55DRAFT_711916 [Colletotrichum godetiae]KAK1690343.1 hypothetical protein BDP55DRAFT_711916 [Colletotrichum godetiae]
MGGVRYSVPTSCRLDGINRWNLEVQVPAKLWCGLWTVDKHALTYPAGGGGGPGRDSSRCKRLSTPSKLNTTALGFAQASRLEAFNGIFSHSTGHLSLPFWQRWYYPSTDSHATHNFRHSVGGLGPTERAPEQSFCFKTLAALHLPRPPLWPDGFGGQLSSTPSRTRLDDALDPSRQDKTGSSLRYRLRTRPQSQVSPSSPQDGQEYEGPLGALGVTGTTNPTRDVRLTGAVDEEIVGLALLGRATRRVRYGYSLRTGTGTDTLPANANPPAWFALATLETPYKVVITEYHLARLLKMRIIWSLSSCVLTAAAGWIPYAIHWLS